MPGGRPESERATTGSGRAEAGPSRRAGAPREVVLVAFEGMQSLDLVGPLEVFEAARGLIEREGRREAPYRMTVASRQGKPLRSSSGLALTPASTLAQAPGRIDTLIVPGGQGTGAASADGELLEWLRGAAPRARRVASVCTGAFLLAAAGLLDGRRATTHWSWAGELARRHPAVRVDPEPIFLRDGKVWTSAGVTAGMDLALALIEEDLDREAALAIARHLVLFLRRPGNQAQFSATLAAQEPAREPLREVRRHVLEHPAADLSVGELARHAQMSPRNFARAFAAETGITPGRFVERVRLEAARRELEDTARPIETIARGCGFGAPETMRRSFLRALGVGPAEYRRRYQPPSEPPSARAA